MMLKEEIEKLKTTQGKFFNLFNKDQVRHVVQGGIQGGKFGSWSGATIKEALRIRYDCGSNGYNSLLNSSLCKHIKNIKMSGAILYEVLDMMKTKVDGMNKFEGQVGILFDEMAVKPNYQYDCRLDSMSGMVNLPNHSGIATHGLVFLLVGVSSRFKQIIAYYFSGNSTDGFVYGPILSFDQKLP